MTGRAADFGKLPDAGGFRQFRQFGAMKLRNRAKLQGFSEFRLHIPYL